jgi:hypothetical protein
MDFLTAIKTCFGKFAVFNGRASRSEYWFFVLFILLASMSIGIADLVAFPKSESRPLGALLLIVVFLPHLGVTIRRLHNTNNSGWDFVVFLSIFVFSGYLLRASDQGSAKGVRKKGNGNDRRREMTVRRVLPARAQYSDWCALFRRHHGRHPYASAPRWPAARWVLVCACPLVFSA